MNPRDLLKITEAPGLTITRPFPDVIQFTDKDGNYVYTDGMTMNGGGRLSGINEILKGLTND
jgi:hypothetical protein